MGTSRARVASIESRVAQSLSRTAIAALFLLLPVSTPTPALAQSRELPPNPIDKPSWELIAHDEFTDDTNIGWNRLWHTGYPFGQWLPPELNYCTRYLRDFTTACSPSGMNHLLDGQSLTLRAKIEPGQYDVMHWDAAGSPYTTCDPFQYTSAMLFSHKLFQYGYFEVRCKVPNDGLVFAPAFWLWEGGNGEYREIDGFEFGGDDGTGNLVPSRVGFNMHLSQAQERGYSHTNSSIDGGDPRNHYPSAFVVPTQDVTSSYHIYAIKWSPSSVTWLVDNNPVYSTPGHSPWLPMHLILNHAITPYHVPRPADFPADYTIDYVRIYRSKADELLWTADNSGNGKVGSWVVSAQDKYIVGDFAQTGRDEIVAFSAAGQSRMLRFDGQEWATTWNMHSNSWWVAAPRYRYVAGDFDGNGRDDMLIVDPGQLWMLGSFSQGDWQPRGGAAGAIGSWTMHHDDWYVAGDFEGIGRDELLAINPSGWAALSRWDGTQWQLVWINHGSGWIDAWHISANGGDKFTVGDFNGNGKAELLATAPWQASPYAHLMEFNGGTWGTTWFNSGNGYIRSWNINPGDKFVAAAFQGGGRDELLAVSQTGEAQLFDWTGSDWGHVCRNDGGGTLNRFRMHPTDAYLAGHFVAGPRERLMAVSSASGWCDLIKVDRP